jgi:putative acetyltransferase
MDIHIRPETAADAPAIHALTEAAFRNAAHTSRTEQHIVDALRAAGKLSVSLVAEAAGTLIGHVAVSPVAISDGASGWYGLGPISVTPGHQGQGVGSRLMREALRLLRERGAAGCVLLGEPGYYGRFGFRAEPSVVLPEVPPEYFQVLVFHGELPRGSVAYHAAFDAQG